MRLEYIPSLRCASSALKGCTYQCLLRVAVWSGQAGAPAILSNCAGLTLHSPHVIQIRQEDSTADRLASGIAIGACIEGVRLARGRSHLRRCKELGGSAIAHEVYAKHEPTLAFLVA
eukprot:2456026-Prymnesium_polylepis.1